MKLSSFFILVGLAQTYLALAADSGSGECEICETVVGLGLSALKDNSNATAISESICSKTSSNDTSECEKITDTIVVKVIDLLEQNVQPSAVCSYLGYC